MLPQSIRRELTSMHLYYRDILVCLTIFVVFAYVGYIAAILSQDRSMDYYQSVREMIFGGGRLPDNVFMYILARNSLVSFTALVLGILTYNIWPVAILALNGAVSGFIVKIQALLFNHYSYEIWLFGLIPHGVPELGALFIACGASFYFRRLRGSGKSVWGRVLAAYCTMVLPLLVLAAAIETFVTPLLIQRFLL